MSSPDTEHRKLSAIMFTDMVGYNALSRQNKALAIWRVPQGRKRIAQRFIAGFNGQEENSPAGTTENERPPARKSLSPLRGLPPLRRLPSVETLGDSLSPCGLEP